MDSQHTNIKCTWDVGNENEVYFFPITKEKGALTTLF